MAVVDRKSAAVTNETATPRVLNNPDSSAALLREKSNIIASAADDTQASVGRFHRIPSNCRVSQLLISAADATTAGAIDIGIYQTAENGGAVVDADLFASAFDLSGGPFNNYDVTFESGQYTYAESETMLWEVLGLASDPCRDYDVAYTITTTFNGGPTAIRLATRYIV